MTSLILSTATRYLLPLLLLFSVFLLLRGHNEPGGGFTGGLVAASAFVLLGVSDGVQAVKRVIRVDPRGLIGIGILIALLSGLPAVVGGQPYLTGLWLSVPVPVFGKLGTPLIFDIGVYFAVIGVVLTIVLALAED